MAQDIFMKISGIEGESQDATHTNEIEISHWDWKISQNSNMHSGSGGGAGKASVDDLTFTHKVDKSSPNLMKYCLTGKHIPEAKLTVRKAGGNPLEYLKITMSDVIISSVQPNCKSTDDVGTEQVCLAFSRVKQEYAVQNAQGGSAGAITSSYDIKGNKEA